MRPREWAEPDWLVVELAHCSEAELPRVLRRHGVGWTEGVGVRVGPLPASPTYPYWVSPKPSRPRPAPRPVDCAPAPVVEPRRRAFDPAAFARHEAFMVQLRREMVEQNAQRAKERAALLAAEMARRSGA